MRFVPELPSQFTTKDSPNSAKSLYIKAMKMGSKNPGEVDMASRYNEVLKSKMKEVREKSMKGSKYSFQLPGTDASECRNLSKGAQEILTKIAEKQARREEKKMDDADKIKITAKNFSGMQGGRIDGKGYIYDSAGQWIMTVDKKTGKIKNRVTGSTVGKYNPSCGYAEHRICELITQLDTSKNAGWYAGGGTSGAAHGESSQGNIWGTQANSCGGGNIWGSGTGNVWGNKSDDNSGGWW